jgi:uncharacterized protein YheU (UPF0270 family)
MRAADGARGASTSQKWRAPARAGPRDSSPGGCQTRPLMDERDEDELEPVEIPPDALSQGALVGLIEEFITREGTDYGAREHSFEEKRASVLRLIAQGEVRIFFDPRSESATLRWKLEGLGPR